MAQFGSFDLLVEEHQKLDVKDRKILFYLLKNSRMSFTEIAKHVGLSKESIQYRFKQLMNRGILQRTFAEVDYERLGYSRFNILLLLDESDREGHENLIKAACADPNVKRVLEFSDNWDVEISCIAKDLKDFDRVCERILDPFEKNIIQKQTSGVIEAMDNDAFPGVKGLKLKEDNRIPKNRDAPLKLDDFDVKILRCLAQDARISTYKMSPDVGLSADAIGLRVKKLVNSGVIRRFTAQLNFSSLAYQGFVFCFNAACLSEKESRQVFQYAASSPNVIGVRKMLGQWDMKMYLVVQNPATLHRVIREMRERFSEIVRSYETWVIYKEHMFSPYPTALEEAKFD